MVKPPKKIHRYTEAGFNSRLNRLKEAKVEALKNVDNLHVKLQPGNKKTGAKVWTVSLLPVLDCYGYCEGCYDFWHDCRNINVIKDRARNSAIHEVDPERYWDEISIQIKANFVEALRINVGGDLKGNDFAILNKIAKENPECDFLFFTKSYSDINSFLDRETFASNVHPIVSCWKDRETPNPHNLPTAHVLYVDGSTTAPEYGAVFCKGNCSQCHHNKTERGCWELKDGEAVIFPAH